MSKDSPLKAYYANLDSSSVRQIPQALQHQAVAQYASQLGGKIVYYIMEEWYTRATMEILQQKVSEGPPVAGFIFFRIAQFFSEDKPNISLMADVLKRGFEIHFVRERISIRDAEELEAYVPLILACSHVARRDRSPETFSEFVKMMDAAQRGTQGT